MKMENNIRPHGQLSWFVDKQRCKCSLHEVYLILMQLPKKRGKNSIQPSETLLNEQYLHSKRLRANKCTSNK